MTWNVATSLVTLSSIPLLKVTFILGLSSQVLLSILKDYVCGVC